MKGVLKKIRSRKIKADRDEHFFSTQDEREYDFPESLGEKRMLEAYLELNQAMDEQTETALNLSIKEFLSRRKQKESPE